MRRFLPLGLLAICLYGQQQETAYPELKEEDETLVQKTDYAFNPLKAESEFRIGEFYWKKKSWRAAAGRYEEATKWNPTYAGAFFRLGEARTRLSEELTLETEKETQMEAARAAFKKFIELEPDGGQSRKARNFLARLERR